MQMPGYTTQSRVTARTLLRRGGFTKAPDKSRIPQVCDWASLGSEPGQQPTKVYPFA
jgi:hypothetical protein